MLNDQSYAKVIADSVTVDGHRLTTMEVRFHRFVLAEFNTHRVFSRNSASSRAIPFAKQVQKVYDDPALPVVWASEQKGMQGGAELPEDMRSTVEGQWNLARSLAAERAMALAGHGVHKSLVNRLLEPFMWHTVVVSSTSWSNFFEQRCSPLAQPEIRVAAEKMLAAHEESTPTLLHDTRWHLPYVQEEDWRAMAERLDDDSHITVEAMLTQVSAARCARVSYLTQDGTRDLGLDLDLYDRLITASPWHGSPLEHVATPWRDNSFSAVRTFIDADDQPQTAVREIPLFGNLIGWRQLRLEIEAAHGFTPLD